MSENIRLRPYAFVLAVPDLQRTIGYFESVLGFRSEWGDGTSWQALVREGVRVMLGHCPHAQPPSEMGDHSYFAYLHVDDLDALHTEIAQRGAIIRQPPTNRTWGMREMEIATPDGHRMVVGQRISNR